MSGDTKSDNRRNRGFWSPYFIGLLTFMALITPGVIFADSMMVAFILALSCALAAYFIAWAS